MKVLVTGGAGFIGSHLTARLLKEGHAVRVLDNFSTGKRENLHAVLVEVDLIEGDIREAALVRRAMQGVEVVFHQAALRSVPHSVEHPGPTNEVNIGGTLNVLLAARDSGVRRVVYASSSSVYGNSRLLPKRESQAPRPVSPYAVTKLAAEMYCSTFYQLYGLETVSLRYFNVFGPRQDPDSPYAAVIPRFMAALLRREAPVIYGDGLQTRDFTYIENVVEANILAMRASAGLGATFNVACGERVSVLHLARSLMAMLEAPVEPVHSAPRPGDVRHTLADISRAQRILGYQPSVDFESGLRRTVAWYSNGRRPSL